MVEYDCQKEAKNKIKVKTKLIKNSLFLFLVGSFFLAGISISRADCECTNDSECGFQSTGMTGAVCRNCSCQLDGACSGVDSLATCGGGSGYLEHSLSGTGPWNWRCVGTRDGAQANCSSGKNNPTKYASLNGDYGRIADDKIDKYGTAGIYNRGIRGYLPYFRIFIPPGTKRIDQGLIYEWNGQNLIVRHKSIPKTNFSDYDYQDGYAFTTLNSQNSANGRLAAFEASDQFIGGVRPEHNAGRLEIIGDNFVAPYLPVSRSGWLYIKEDSYKSSSNSAHDMAFFITVDAKTYNDWYDHSGSNSDGSINWAKDVEGIEIYSPNDTTCNAKTCVGNSCWNGTAYIPGTKTKDCATGQALANPTSLTSPGSSYLIWTSQGAKSVEAECPTGPVTIKRGDWFLSDAECKASGLVKECTNNGYEMKFTQNQTGTQTCILYPTNISDGLPGTPFSVTIQVTGAPACGNSIVEGTEECDYNPSLGLTNYVPCPTGKTCQNCKCVTPTKIGGYVCQPDDPNCAKSTCKDVKCFDGCNYQQGSKDCKGRE